MDTKFTKNFNYYEIMKANKISTIIVTYNPDINRFKKVVYALNNQIDKLILVDNGSTNSNKILNVLENKNFKTKYVLLKQNLGLAKGLNMGIRLLEKSDFVLTLDQDTIIKKNAIETIINDYKKLDKRIQKKTAIIHLNYEKMRSRLIDRFVFKSLILDKSEFKHNKNYYKNFFPVKFVIQSGMLIKFMVIKKFKFNEALFIDQIDREYCSKITRGGFIILKSKKILARHRLGIGIRINNQIIRYENKARLYYFTRNSAYLLKTQKLPFLEYMLDIALFYRKYILVKGLGSIPSLIQLYISATVEGFMGKLGKIKELIP